LFYASIIKRLRTARASLMEIYVNPRPVITLVINSRDYRVSRSPPRQDSFAGIFLCKHHCELLARLNANVQ